MENKEFTQIRLYLNKTQQELGQQLCVSPKAIQSYEQGWRHIPVHVERQLLFLLGLKRGPDESKKPCWDINDCPVEWREKCSAWELEAGHFCWFINGTYCRGKSQEHWRKKIELCRQCEVFRAMLPGV